MGCFLTIVFTIAEEKEMKVVINTVRKSYLKRLSKSCR